MNPNSFIKALKMPKDSHPIIKKWHDFRFWFQINIWYRFAPHWLRIFKLTFSHWWYQQVSSRIFPRNKWATKLIGRTWHDKPELIRSFLFGAIVDFVDGEKCFETVVWDEEDVETIKLHEVYAWAKTGREIALNAQEKLWSPGPLFDKKGKWVGISEKGDLKAYHEAEDAIDKKDTEYLTWIIVNRAILWT